MSLALASRRAAISPAWVKNPLWRTARAVPSLDQPFADTKSLTDAVTGQSLVTFTRASSGTSVGSDGLIKTATTNLLLRSEEFDNASWTKQQSSISSNVTTAPNGTLTADKLIEDSSNNIHTAYVFPTGLRAASALTFSVYAKSSERTSFALDVRSVGNGFRAVFDLSAQTAIGAAVGSGTLIGAGIQSMGNGWFRCFVTGSHPTDTSLNTTIRLNNPAGTDTYTGDGTSGLFLWGAQLEQSSTVGEYIPTTSTINSAPRFDHNPTTGESLGLLVEEQRTNICPQSEDFTNNQAINNVTISSNQIAAPDGAVTADLVTATLAGSSNTCWVQQIASIAASTTSYASSFFVKQGTSPSVTLNVAFSGGTYTEIFVRFDFSTKSISIGGGGAGAATAGYQQLQNGWFRVWAIFPNNNTGTAITHRIYTRSEGTTNAVGDSVYLWGRMTEAGAFPTSYIPTTTAAATRSADVASITGANFSSWYRQDEGTVFADLVTSSRGHNAYPRIVAILGSDVNTGNEASIYTRNISSVEDYRLFGVYWDAIGSSADFNPGSGAPLGSGRVAMAIKNNDGGYCVNGAAPFSDTSCAVPTSVQLRLFGVARFQPASSGYIRRLTYWPARLPNSTLQAITQ